MDIESTQVLDFELDEEEAEDHLNGNVEREKRPPVATLKMLMHEGNPEASFSIYNGPNIIGRGASNGQINLSGKGVSKRHAVIDVDGDTHMVYDLNSRNKTRKGKFILKPQVRYEIKEGDVLTFGDIICRYLKISQALEDDSGSETGSESLLPQGTPTPPLTINGDVGDDGDNGKENDSKQLLTKNATSTRIQSDKDQQPPLAEKSACSDVSQGLLLRSDSEDSNLDNGDDILPSSIPPKLHNARNILVPETPETEEPSPEKNQDDAKECDSSNKKTAKSIKGLVDFNLESETDIESEDDEVAALMAAPTQVYELNENCKDSTDKEVLKRTDQMKGKAKQDTCGSKKPTRVEQDNDTIDWMDLPTQPYVMVAANKAQEDDDEGSSKNSPAALKKSNELEKTNARKTAAAHLGTVDEKKLMETNVVTEELKTAAIKGKPSKRHSSSDSNSSDWAILPTQRFPTLVRLDEDDEGCTVDQNKLTEASEAAKEPKMVAVEGKPKTLNSRSNSDSSDWANLPTQLFPTSVRLDEDDEGCTVNQKKLTEASEAAKEPKMVAVEGKPKTLNSRSDSDSSDWTNLPTQPFPKTACQEDEDSDDPVFDAATQIYPLKTNKKPGNESDEEINLACVDTVPIEEINLGCADTVTVKRTETGVSDKIQEATTSAADDNEDDALFTSPCTDEESQRMRTAVQKVLESPALASQDDSTSRKVAASPGKATSSRLPASEKKARKSARAAKRSEATETSKAHDSSGPFESAVKNLRGDIDAAGEMQPGRDYGRASRITRGLSKEKAVPEPKSSRRSQAKPSLDKEPQEEPEKGAAKPAAAFTRLTRKKLRSNSPDKNAKKVDERSPKGSSAAAQVATTEAATSTGRTSNRRAPSATVRKRKNRIISSDEEEEEEEDQRSALALEDEATDSDDELPDFSHFVRRSKDSSTVLQGPADGTATGDRLTRAKLSANSPGNRKPESAQSTPKKLDVPVTSKEDTPVKKTKKSKGKSSTADDGFAQVDKTEQVTPRTRKLNRRSLSNAIKKLKSQMVSSDEEDETGSKSTLKDAAASSDDGALRFTKLTRNSRDRAKTSGLQRQSDAKVSRKAVGESKPGLTVDTVRQSPRVSRKKADVNVCEPHYGAGEAAVKTVLPTDDDSDRITRESRAKSRKPSAPQKRPRAAEAEAKVPKESPAPSGLETGTRADQKRPKVAQDVTESSKAPGKKSPKKGKPTRLSSRRPATPEVGESNPSSTRGKSRARKGRLAPIETSDSDCGPHKGKNEGDANGFLSDVGSGPDASETLRSPAGERSDPKPLAKRGAARTSKATTSKRSRKVSAPVETDESVAEVVCDSPSAGKRPKADSRRNVKDRLVLTIKKDAGTALPVCSSGGKRVRKSTAAEEGPPVKSPKVSKSGRSEGSERRVPNPSVVDSDFETDALVETDGLDSTSSFAEAGKAEQPKRAPKRNARGGKRAGVPSQQSPVATSTPKPARGRPRSKGAADNSVEENEGPFTALLTKSTPTSKRSRESGAAQQELAADTKSQDIPRIMFTGISESNLQKVVKSLKGELVDSIFDCTHLVTDKVRRTWKFLCSLARGCYIVSPSWLQDCKAAKKFIDASTYVIEDVDAEAQYKFCLKDSLGKASKKPFLRGLKVHATRNVMPKPQEMQTIIECAGGKFLARMPTSGSDTIVVTCPKDLPLCAKARSAGIPIVGTEFILTGVLRQEAITDEYLC